jgi:lipoprotein-anchoring transpeptidase ErfK/SrfK
VSGVALGVVVLLAVSASGTSLRGADAPEPAAQVALPSPTPTPTQSPAPLRLAISPKAKAKDLPISTEIGTRVSGGSVAAVTLTERGGGQVAGSLRADGSAWVPDKPLKFGRTYSAKVTASGPGGQTQTRTTTFSTMGSAGPRVGTGLYMFSGQTYGVAMPVVVEFSRDIPAKARAGVQRRLLVTSDPPQPGAWRWFGARQVLYRPQVYWQPGTKLSVRIALDGHPMGNGWYGDTDRSASVTIGRRLEMKVENKTKKMTVYEDGRVIRTIPVSLGKPSTPSSSGTMVIMDRQEQTVFDTFAELGPEQGYRVDITWAQRLTWGGQFIHAAPWSVGDQGRRNVSHGCVNMSTANARWLFGRTKIGDPITVRGTERGLDPGDGWTVWNMSWAQYVRGTIR